MSLIISKVFTYDTDAGDYIQRVEGASGDNQALEPATRQAINNFVIGCKQDGIWNAIKASCILSGARTLNGALQPLAGTAPTNVGGNFVSGDYNRKIGLVGNGTNKSLRTGLLANALSNTSHHMFFNGSGLPTSPASQVLGGVYNGSNITSLFDIFQISNIRETRSGTVGNSPGNSATISTGSTIIGSVAGCRTSATELRLYQDGLSVALATNSNTPSLPAIGFGVFARNDNGTQVAPTEVRFNFFSIGDGLSTTSMLSLHNRVSALISAFGVAIP